MRGMTWSKSVVVAAVAAMFSALIVAGPVRADNSVDINLVLINDFQGQIDEHTVQWAGTVQGLMDDSPNSLLISAGDNVGTSTQASAIQHDNPAIDVLNAVGVDVSTVGNHELDRGIDDLANRIVPRADFPIIGANLFDGSGAKPLASSATFTMSGVTVAVVGAVTQETPQLLDSSLLNGATFSDPVAAINSEVARLDALPESDRPDVIVASVHDGAPWGTWKLDQAKLASASFASIVDDLSAEVDVIATGHSHNNYVFNAPVPGDESRTRPVIQSGYNGQFVGQVSLTVDPDTGDVTVDAAKNVARVTTSDADLMASYPALAQVAQIRDDAVAFVPQYEAAEIAAQTAQVDLDAANAQAAEATAEYDTAVASSETALSAYSASSEAAQTATDAYNAAVADMTVAKQEYTTALDAAAEAEAAYDQAMAERTAAGSDYASAAAAVTSALADYSAASAAAQKAQGVYAVAVQVMERARADYTAAMQAALYDAAKVAYDTYCAAQKQSETAVSDYTKAVESGKVAQVDYTSALAAAQDAATRYQAATTAAAVAQTDYAEAMAAADVAAADYLAALSASQSAVSDYSVAAQLLRTASEAYSTAIAAAQAALEAVAAATTAADVAQAAYDAAVQILTIKI